MACLLCGKTRGQALFFKSDHHHFLKCGHCTTVYRNPQSFLGPQDEKARYLEHHNDPEDPGYQNFVTPLVEQVKAHFPPATYGLDYGAGTGPVIAKLLKDAGYRIDLYDPFFHPDQSGLKDSYDFIVCCEVIEHFHRPLEEFERLYGWLRNGGRLYCQTDPLLVGENFERWYYKDDPTHVLFYNPQNLEWIREKVGFFKMILQGRVIRLQR